MTERKTCISYEVSSKESNTNEKNYYLHTVLHSKALFSTIMFFVIKSTFIRLVIYARLTKYYQNVPNNVCFQLYMCISKETEQARKHHLVKSTKSRMMQLTRSTRFVHFVL